MDSYKYLVDGSSSFPFFFFWEKIYNDGIFNYGYGLSWVIIGLVEEIELLRSF